MPSTVRRHSFLGCNWIPQLCYLRSWVECLQVLNQYFRVWILDERMKDKRRWGSTDARWGGAVFPALVYLGKLYSYHTLFPLSTRNQEGTGRPLFSRWSNQLCRHYEPDYESSSNTCIFFRLTIPHARVSPIRYSDESSKGLTKFCTTAKEDDMLPITKGLLR